MPETIAPLTRLYAEFVAGCTPVGLPAAALEVARLGFTDSTAAILGGRRQEVLARLSVHLERLGGTKASRLMFSARRASLTQAGLVNATAAHALDYDDFAFSNHPSAVLVPTILAAADTNGATGARMATAYVAGYEVWSDIMSREPDHIYDRGWHPTAVFGPIGAAAAAGVVLGLDAERASHALALAASIAGGVFENFGTMAKPLHGGRAAEAGLTAASLALAGMEASPTALEGRHGLLHAVSPQGRVDRTTRPKLGERWRVVELRLNIKKHPVVGAAQRAIDATLALRQREKIDLDRITAIVARVSERHAAVMPFHRPTTALQAKFSLEFAVACALIHGAVGLDQLRDEIVDSPRLQSLMSKVTIETTTEFEPGWRDAAPYDEVRLSMTDGMTLASPRIRRATGHADTPLSTAEIWAKFSSCAAFTGVSPAATEALFAAMQRIDSLSGPVAIPDVGEVP